MENLGYYNGKIGRIDEVQAPITEKSDCLRNCVSRSTTGCISSETASMTQPADAIIGFTPLRNT